MNKREEKSRDRRNETANYRDPNEPEAVRHGQPSSIDQDERSGGFRQRAEDDENESLEQDEEGKNERPEDQKI